MEHPHPFGNLSFEAVRGIEEALDASESTNPTPIELDPYALVYTPFREDIEELAKRCNGQNLLINYASGKLLPAYDLIHALDHDISTGGMYRMGCDPALLCHLQNNRCGVIKPEELIQMLNKLRLSSFGKKASRVWTQSRIDPTGHNFKSEKEKPYTEKDRASLFFSLKADTHSPILTAKVTTGPLMVSTDIMVTEPTTSNLFDTKTEISFGRGVKNRIYAAKSPVLSATSATTLSLVLRHVTI